MALNRALDSLSADLVTRSQQLTQLDGAIGLRARQLAEFYEIEVAADTLATLVATHDQRKAEWESLALAKAAELEQRLEARQRAWEAQAAEARAACEASKRHWLEAFEQEQSVKDLVTRNEVLQRDLHEATDKVRDIALKAIEGASGAAALARVSEIALQHAKAREG